MAKLSAFRADTRSITDGRWIRVNEAMFDDLEILSRGYTDDFLDAQNLRLTRAAEPFGGDQTRIPNAVRRTVNASLLRDFLVLDVRNLEDDRPDHEGEQVKLEDFLTMCEQLEYGRLARAAFEAAGRVTTQSAEQTKAAVGNSPGGSPSP